MSYLLDTDWVASYLNGRQDAVALFSSLEGGRLAISLITYGEIYDGIYSGRDPGAFERGFRGVLGQVDVLPLNRAILRRFALIRGSLRRRGQLIGDFDTLIAATALHHDLILVTRNVRHFQRIPDLRLYRAN